MPKRAKELGAFEIRRLAQREVTCNTFFAVGGVAGLVLQVTPSGATSWLFRKVIGGKRRSIGLGGYPDIGLKTAREAARFQLGFIQQGKDPFEKKAQDALELKQSQARRVIFKDLARQIHGRYIESGKWKNAKHGQQWINTLTTFAFPEIGEMVVEDITRDDVLRVLEPIWNTKHETATRVRSRMYDIFETAEADGLRFPPNPADKAQLKTRLITSAEAKKKDPFPSLPHHDLPRFMKHLRSSEIKNVKVLEFSILTNVRKNAVLNAKWSEIDLDRKTWIVPVDMNKRSPKPHEAALSDAAIEILRGLERTCDYVFPSNRGTPFSDPCRNVVRNMQKQTDRKYIDPQILDKDGQPRGIVPHGFRATFKTYMEEREMANTMVIERCMQHKPQNPLDQNYMRSSMLELRLEAMNRWAEYCATIPE